MFYRIGPGSSRYILCHRLVSYPDPFISHAEKGSGETCIQFWFRAARSGCGQSDCRTASTSLPRLKKNCDSNLREPREGWPPFVQQTIDEATCLFSSAKFTQGLGEARSSAVCTCMLIIMQMQIVLLFERNNASWTFNAEPKLHTHFTRLFFPHAIKESGHKTSHR